MTAEDSPVAIRCSFASGRRVVVLYCVLWVLRTGIRWGWVGRGVRGEEYVRPSNNHESPRSQGGVTSFGSS